MALRASVSVADVCLERKIRYDFAKLKARKQLRSIFQSHYALPRVQHQCASATNVAKSLHSSNRQSPPLLVENDLSCKLTYAMEFQHIHSVWEILQTRNLVRLWIPGLRILAPLHQISRETIIPLPHRSTPEAVGVPVKAHEQLFSNVSYYYITLARM